MATVYLAEDLKHHRKVAIKVLRPELAAVIGAARFLKEIETTANLQHPHILPLFDSGEINGTVFYVMPYIDGESLRDRLNREKQLPIPVAVRIATEVAAALDYAHRHGIIHRDIKPENVLLHDDTALVADFGIALAASKVGGSRMTETGMSLGTPHYMSPEQAMGEREITARSDVYALGAMTYEMLAGDPPFTGSTAQAIVAKVLTEDPRPLTVTRKTVPPQVESAVLTALAKLPADRFASAGEFAEALTGEPRSATTVLRSARPRRARRMLTLVVPAVGLLAAGVIAGELLARRHMPVVPPSRLAILVPSLGSGSSSLARQISLTPTGDAVLYVSMESNGQNAIFFQPLDAEPTLVAGSTNFWSPQISHDGRWVMASTLSTGTSGAIRLSLEGGTPTGVPERVYSTNGAWAADGSFWFSERGGAGVARLKDDSVARFFPERTRGLRLEQVIDHDRSALVVRTPTGSSSGPALLLDLGNGSIREIIDRPVVEARVGAGELVAVTPDGSLISAPFNEARGRITGSWVTLATGVMLSGTAVAQFAVAGNGTLAYIPESPRALVFLDRNGAERQGTEERPNIHAPRFSPDGRRLSLDITSADGRDVWLLSLDDGTLSRTTFDRDGHDATWTPDGHFLTYISFKSGVLGILRTRPGSSAPAESLLASEHLAYTGNWVPGANSLLTTGANVEPQSGTDIVMVRNGGRGPIEPVLATPFQEQYPVLSPDGRWLAFVSDQSGKQEVYVRPLNGEGEQIQVSLDGGVEPVWAPTGLELFYRTIKDPRIDLMAAEFRTAPELAVASRRALFPVTDMLGSAPHANYDISPDGRTFAMVRRSPSNRIIVIQNFPELARRLRGSSQEGRK